MLTRGELDGLTAVTAITVLVLILASAWAAWVQDREVRRLDADVDELWGRCAALENALGWTGDGDQGPDDGPDDDDDPPPDDPDDGPATVIAHPADTWARKAALLDRYQHIGQHRT